MSIKRSVRNNVILNYIYKGLLSFDFTATLWVVFMYSKGLSLGQIGLAEAIYHITAMIMQIPTGIIADRLGRRFSRVIGAVLYLIDAFLMLYADNFFEFCLIFIISSLAGCMESGAGDALAYESIKELGIENTYRKIAGRIVLIMNFAEAISMFLGGILAQKDILTAYTATALAKFVLVIVSLMFIEPDRGKNNVIKESVKDQFIKSLLVVYRNKLLFHFIVLNSIFQMVIFITVFYGRKYFEDMGMGYQTSGFIYTIYLVIGAAFGYFIHKLSSFFSLKRVAICLSTFIIIGFCGFVTGICEVSIISFMLIGISAGIIFPLFSDYINSNISSEYRAAILSIDGTLFSIMMVTFFPVVGLIADKAGLISAFRIIALPSILIIIFECYNVCCKIKKISA